MANLKHILFRIAQLPLSDQRWVLRRLSEEQRVTLEQNKGLMLLRDAQRFRKLKANNLVLSVESPLPAYCQQLACKAPLYIAVVMEQGAYPWQSLFLQQFDKEGLIQSSLHTRVPHIKLLVKHALFREWEQSISFDAYLDKENNLG